MASSAAPKANVLNSWKEIASYLGRGVRTVQRWEHDLAMPVRRPRAKSRSAVVALPEEIDAWLRTAPSNEINRVPKTAKPHGKFIMAETLAAAEDLRHQCETLRTQHHRAVMNLMDNLRAMQNSVKICVDTAGGRELPRP